MCVCVIYLLYQFAYNVEKEDINSVQLKQLLNGNNWRKVFLYRCEVTYQYIQLVYQNACRPNFKRNATMPKEIYLNPTYFKNLCLILQMLLIFTRLCQFEIDIIILFPALLHPLHQGWSTIIFRSQRSLCLPKIADVLSNISPLVPSDWVNGLIAQWVK